MYFARLKVAKGRKVRSSPLLECTGLKLQSHCATRHRSSDQVQDFSRVVCSAYGNEGKGSQHQFVNRVYRPEATKTRRQREQQRQPSATLQYFDLLGWRQRRERKLASVRFHENITDMKLRSQLRHKEKQSSSQGLKLQSRGATNFRRKVATKCGIMVQCSVLNLRKAPEGGLPQSLD